MSVIGIVAVDRRGAIGRGGKMPWHYPADLRFFKEQTAGHVVVMGYRTWLSLREVPLPDRLNLVLSRCLRLTAHDSVIFLPHESKVLALQEHLRSDLFVIGGRQVYDLFLPHIDRWIVTEIPRTIEDADTFMPDNFLDGFAPTGARDLGEGLAARFYEREAATTLAFPTRNP